MDERTKDEGTSLMAIVKAEMVFTREAGFTEEEVARIGAAGAGRTISFRGNGRGGPEGSGRGGQGRWLIEDLVKETRDKTHAARDGQLWSALCVYARGETADKVAEKMGISRRQFFHWLKAVRTEMAPDAVERGRASGLSWRELGRLLGKSHEAIRQAAGEQEGGRTTTD